MTKEAVLRTLGRPSIRQFEHAATECYPMEDTTLEVFTALRNPVQLDTALHIFAAREPLTEVVHPHFVKEGGSLEIRQGKFERQKLRGIKLSM